jgi:hypothetical protein
MSLVDDVREGAAWVAERARSVRIDHEAIPAYAARLPAEPPEPAPDLDTDDLEARAAFSLQLDAVNFGSGWFPTLKKPAGLSGYRTVEAGLREHGPFTREELTHMTPGRIAAVMGQEPGHELMALFARALNELGERVDSFAGFAARGQGSAVRLAEELATWPMWRDVSSYEGREIPFFKRAQIAPFDLHLQGIAPARDVDRLTIFADNLVPHVLRLDGVLTFERRLLSRIEAGELLEHGSPEEVEIRAAAIHATELLVAAHGDTTAGAADNWLWNRGAGERYKAAPRHRSRTTAY